MNKEEFKQFKTKMYISLEAEDLVEIASKETMYKNLEKDLRKCKYKIKDKLKGLMKNEHEKYTIKRTNYTLTIEYVKLSNGIKGYYVTVNYNDRKIDHTFIEDSTKST
jgi:hypothetical protein